MQRHDTAREALPVDAGKARRPHHFGKRARLGKLADRFDEIAIGVGVAGHRTAERRNDLERKQIVDSIEPGHVDSGKFQAQEPAAGPQHAIGFAEREIDPRHVADAECDGVGIETAVRESQCLGVSFHERHPVVEMPRRRALAADVEHIGIDVADGGAKTDARRLGGTKRDVAGTAGNVEQRKRHIAARWIERIDHHLFPEAMQARRHQVVHQVVARRHAVEHVVHQRLLVAQGDVPEAKMRGLVRPIHVFTPSYGQRRTIARPPQWRYHVSISR